MTEKVAAIRHILANLSIHPLPHWERYLSMQQLLSRDAILSGNRTVRMKYMELKSDIFFILRRARPSAPHPPPRLPELSSPMTDQPVAQRRKQEAHRDPDQQLLYFQPAGLLSQPVCCHRGLYNTISHR